MRLRKNMPEADMEAVECIRNGLDGIMSARGRDFQIRSERAHRTLAALTDADKKRLKARRMPGIELAHKSLVNMNRKKYSYESAIGQLSSMPDCKYNAILADAALAGITPGAPFIHVCINRCDIRYVREITSMDEIMPMLETHVCLSERPIKKLYVAKRDAWVLYTHYKEGYKHVADVFGIDLTDFEERTMPKLQSA